MSEASNKMTVDMGILTSSKDKELKRFYGKIIRSPLDIRMIYKRLSKKKMDTDIAWGIIALIGYGELTQEEYEMIEGWVNIGEKYLDERGMQGLLIHIERAVRKYVLSKGIEEDEENEGDDKDIDNFDFENYLKSFEVNSIILKGDCKLYHVCYIEDDLCLCDRYNNDKKVIKGLVISLDKISAITKDDDERLKDRKLYRIV